MVVVLGAIAIIAAGIAGAVVGERDIEHHHESLGVTAPGTATAAPGAPIIVDGGAS